MFTLYPCFLAQKRGKERNDVILCITKNGELGPPPASQSQQNTKIPKALAAPVWNSHKGLEPQVKMPGKSIFLQEINEYETWSTKG